MTEETEHPYLSTPSFVSLPLDPAGPRGNAWFRFGTTDTLGMLNLLTPSVVARAAQEIKTGIRVSLDWPLNKPLYPSFGREAFKHELINRPKKGVEGLRCVNDDWIGFNTQGGSQWDGFRHFGNVKEKRYFNGITHEQVMSSPILGIDTWAESGGITGCGVLLDYASWATQNNIPVLPFSRQVIPLSHLQSIISEQKITFHPGDVLFIRSGFSAAFNSLTDSEQEALTQRPSADFIGVESSESTLKFLWENQFAAVAGDAPAFERSPVMGDHVDARYVLHEWLLAGWGMPIGEMFDLERLAETCRRLGRWKFFLCSVPLKVPGGVASPPNAIAIF